MADAARGQFTCHVGESQESMSAVTTAGLPEITGGRGRVCVRAM